MRRVRPLRTRRGLELELRRAEREIRELGDLDTLNAEAKERWTELRGIQQALAWALNDNAMAPVKALGKRSEELEALIKNALQFKALKALKKALPPELGGRHE